MLWHKVQGAGGVGGFVPPEYVGGATTTQANTLSFSAITDLSQRDTVIFAASDSSNNFSMSSTGWSGMTPSFPDHTAVRNIDYLVGYKVMGATPDTSAVITNTRDVLCAVAFRNIGTPNATLSGGHSTLSNSFSVPSMTVDVEGSISVIISMLDDDNASILTVPTGYTLAVQTGTTGGSMAIMYRLNMPAGATGVASGSWSSVDDLRTIAYIIPPP